jgi:hypothetical protein
MFAWTFRRATTSKREKSHTDSATAELARAADSPIPLNPER